MTRHLASEGDSVQYPLIRHAEEIGWLYVPRLEALGKRGGEDSPFFRDELRAALLRLNPGLVTDDNVDAVIAELESAPPTMEGNRLMLEWLRGNRTIFDEREGRRRNVTLVDFDNAPGGNVFQVTDEWVSRIAQRKANRADVVFLINGIPVAIVENKNPKAGDAIERAVVQLRRYELETPELLAAPQLFNVTHLVHYHYGVTWNYTRKGIFNWKEESSETYREAVHSFFDHRGFLLMLKEWILFFEKDEELQKTVLRQHQTRAVLKVVARCASPDKRRGLVWHTQGSGKTFTLITSARLILEDRERFPGATVLLVVDRNELEGQLSGWVERMIGEMRGSRIAIEYAWSKARLQELLDADFRGLIISMIHKFDGIRKDSCTRRDVYVLIDEAHRSVSGPNLGNYLVGALPNATMIGFTGTPIDKTAYGAGTFKTFGVDDEAGYLDKYSIRESIEDETTVKLRHTLAPMELALPAEILEKEFLSLAEAEGVSDIEELNRILERAVTLRAFLKSADRVDKAARFIAQHFRENVEPLGYKAFVVAVDREACALYKEALDRYLPTEYSVPVYARNAADVVERPAVARLQLDEAGEKAARKAFPKPDKLPKIFIVTDKLLTGFDAPVLYCMYLDKPMRDHVLLQAVARVNRPFEDERGVKKPCGLIIDFVGVLRELNKALAFDSDEVESVIEDLDLLLHQFRTMMDGDGARYLTLMEGPGGNDAIIDRLVNETFFEKERRKEFADFFREVEGLYEILSPSSELRDYITPYNRLADLYAILRNAYAHRGAFGADLAHKTERLIRENTTALGEYALGRSAEFDAASLEMLRNKGDDDNGKVLNLVRKLRDASNAAGDEQPLLLSLAERAEHVLDSLEDRQLSTQQALEEITRLLDERAQAERVREEHGLDAETFSIYWVLRNALPADAITLAQEVREAQRRYPNALSNSDEQRQLKAELYRLLLRFGIEGPRMLAVAEQVLRVGRT
jgi:type I restriction enzyme R subunit